MEIKKIKTRPFKTTPSITTNKGSVNSIYIEYSEGERTAKCTCCGRLSFSQDDLPFFRKLNGEHDEYYCGLRGWE